MSPRYWYYEIRDRLKCLIFGHHICGGCGSMTAVEPCYVSRSHCLTCGKEWS